MRSAPDNVSNAQSAASKSNQCPDPPAITPTAEYFAILLHGACQAGSFEVDIASVVAPEGS
jgi:hypothetical protein